jgi:hypothetical protein
MEISSASIYSRESLSTPPWREYGIITESRDRCYIHGMSAQRDVVSELTFGFLVPLLL